MKNMLSVASFTEEERLEGDMCLSQKWKGERKGGGQRGGFAEAGAAEGPPAAESGGSRTDGCGWQELRSQR